MFGFLALGAAVGIVLKDLNDRDPSWLWGAVAVGAVVGFVVSVAVLVRDCRSARTRF